MKNKPITGSKVAALTILPTAVHSRGAVVKDTIEQCETAYVDDGEVFNVSSADEFNLSPLPLSLAPTTTTTFPSVSSFFTNKQSISKLPTISKSISRSTNESGRTKPAINILSNHVFKPQTTSAFEDTNQNEIDNICSSLEVFSDNSLLHVQNRMRTNVVTVLKECETELKSCIGFVETYVNVLKCSLVEYRTVSITAEGMIVVVLRTGDVTPPADQERVEPQNIPVPQETPVPVETPMPHEKEFGADGARRCASEGFRSRRRRVARDVGRRGRRGALGARALKSPPKNKK
ncbi:hypothetical protein QE152_g4560 [Popillia japonica]|uniref:Uncharacterized protein n=1 Tax=Popillia japonica TaxID=7064 RepID=A0AAW1N272_POPJA